MEFDSAYVYVSSGTDIRDKICKIDAIINALFDVALKAAANDNITQYSLDDGQVKINTTYKGTDSVYKSIEAFRRLRNEYINQLNGRVMRMVDSKSFTGRRY
jgi:hypothetical protein